MLVEFTVKNFRSIRTEQTLSFYTESNSKNHLGNISFLEDEVGVLKSSCIYGANASGKTNILLALKSLSELIIHSSDWKQDDEITLYEPYLLSKSCINSPTEFDLEFYLDGKRYRYQIHFDKFNITYEKLGIFNTKKESRLFERSSPDDWRGIKHEGLSGGTKTIPLFGNNSYLSKSGDSADTPQIMRDIYNFFRRDMQFVLDHLSPSMAFWDEQKFLKDITNTFLKEADLGIEKFEFETKELPYFIKENFSEDDTSDFVKKIIESNLGREEVFFHQNENNELVKFSKDKESRGTQKLFNLIPVILNMFVEGEVLLIDEIENSFHPHIAKLILKLFNDPSLNVNNAQLIFTTHDLTLMSSDILRKEQIYLVEKCVQKGSEYTSLDEFDSSLKNHSPFAKWYDEGKLGAIPHLNYSNISENIKRGLEHAKAQKEK